MIQPVRCASQCIHGVSRVQANAYMGFVGSVEIDFGAHATAYCDDGILSPFSAAAVPSEAAAAAAAAAAACRLGPAAATPTLAVRACALLVDSKNARWVRANRCRDKQENKKEKYHLISLLE